MGPKNPGQTFGDNVLNGLNITCCSFNQLEAAFRHLKSFKNREFEGQVDLSWTKMGACRTILKLCWAILWSAGSCFPSHVGSSSSYVGRSCNHLLAMLNYSWGFLKEVQYCLDLWTNFVSIFLIFWISWNFNFSVFAWARIKRSLFSVIPVSSNFFFDFGTQHDPRHP